jgi:hypothetical protein
MRKGHRAMNACFYCFQRHKEGAERHLNLCLKTYPKRIRLPKDDVAAFEQHHMYLPINFKIFYKILYLLIQNHAHTDQLKYTSKEGNEGVVRFAIEVFDCDHDITFQKSYVGPCAMGKSCLAEQTEILLDS